MTKAGRVGVAPTEVDEFGKIKSSSGGDSYSKEESDNRYEAKTDIGGLKFRVEEGTAQYKTPEGEWTNFNSGGGGSEGELLWENPSPTATTGFNVDVDVQSYSEITIECVFAFDRVGEDNKGKVTVNYEGGNKPVLCVAPWGSNNSIIGGRIATLQSNRIEFSNGMMFAGGSFNRNDGNNCLPVAIYGK